MRINRTIVFYCIIAYCLFSNAQTNSVYDYNLFLNTVKQTNPLSQKAENNIIYGKNQLNAAKGNFDPQISANIENKHFNTKNYFTYANAEIKQPLYTSQFLKAGYQYGQGVFLNPEFSTPLIGLPYFGLEASILQGLLFDKRRASVVKARHYEDYFNAEQQIQMNDLLYAASNIYIDALYAKKINGLYSYFAILAEQRLKGVSQLADIGERPTIDTVEAAIFLQSRLLDRQSGEVEMIKRVNDLSFVSTLAIVKERSDIVLSDSIEHVYRQFKKNLQNVLIAEQKNNPVLSQYFAKQKVLETEMRLKREMIKPVLDLSYNFLSNSSDIFYPSLSTNNYKWGANFSFPLLLRSSRNEYKMAALDVKNNELETTNKQNQIAFKRKSILEALQLISEQILNAERSRNYNVLLVEAEKLKFANGESSLFLLNSRESKWLESEVKLVECKMKFVKNILELTYVNGDLNYGIN